MIDDLFRSQEPSMVPFSLGGDALLLQNFLTKQQTKIIVKQLSELVHVSPFRYMLTPRGHQMSVAMTNCGHFGWITDHRGYRYSNLDPLTKMPWPTMPPLFYQLACQAAEQAGFQDFAPNACLINEYDIVSKMSLHQDKDERNLHAPIVSFSLGLSAIFLWGGLTRSAKVAKVTLQHGDTVVWGGKDRLRFHGIASIAHGCYPELGKRRINLTFRQVY